MFRIPKKDHRALGAHQRSLRACFGLLGNQPTYGSRVYRPFWGYRSTDLEFRGLFGGIGVRI